MKVNQKYINEYNRTHYKQFKVALLPAEYNELEALLKKLGMSKVQFVREGLKCLKTLKNPPKDTFLMYDK